MGTKFDIAIIGGGPGGYVAAIRASQLGFKVALIEKEHLGGICLNWGCIPTKTLLRSAEISHILHDLELYGFTADNIKFDLNKIVERSRRVAKQLAGGVKHLLTKNKVTIFEGRGVIQKPGLIKIYGQDKTEQELNATHIIIATGAVPRTLPNIIPDGNLIVTYKEAMTPKTLPARLLIIGSGAIGVEFTSFYANMGSKVTLLEVQNRILQAEDEEIAEMAKQSFVKQGIEIILSASVDNIKLEKSEVKVKIKKSDGSVEQRSFDKVILAVGITANTNNIGLENTKVKVEKNHIITDSYMQTAEKNIYAIGDVTGGPWLAHKASHEGVLCVEKIAGLEVKPLDRNLIPGCTYARPQIASVGYTERQAQAAGYNIKVGRFPYIGNGKASSLGETEGLIKTIFDEKTGELLGAHMIGAEVTELIQGFVIAKNLEATEAELMHTIFAHPTLSEMMHESVLSAFDKVIHY